MSAKIPARLFLTAALCVLPAAVMAQASGSAPRGSSIGQPDAPAGVSSPFANRGGNLPASVTYLQAEGIKLTALGDDGGTQGYLGEAANGRYQVFYAAPDGEHVAVGILYRSGGGNVTSDQIGRMLKRFSDAASQVPGADPSAAPAPALPPEASGPDVPFADWMKSQGVKLTPFDSRDGDLDAFLAETPGSADGAPGKMQPFYVMPDKRFAVAGVLVKKGGQLVTMAQIAKLQERYLDKARIEQNGAASDVKPGPNPPVPPPADAAKAIDPVPPGGQQAQPAPAPAPISAPVPSFPPPNAPAQESSAAPAPVIPDVQISSKPASASEQFRNKTIDRATFVEALKTAVWFAVGSPTAPTLYMVADPQCPFCHATWEKIRPLVFARKLQVRVIMIAGLRGSDPIARSILSRDNPSEAWLVGEGSMRNVRVQDGPAPGTAGWEKAGRFLDINANFIHRFDIGQTPFLAYLDRNNALFTSSGVPDDFDAFFAALR